MPVNILVLGTSNSLLKHGWVAGLKAAMPDASIKNMSVGASPGIQFSLYIGLDYSKFDYVFFDSVPNDEEINDGACGQLGRSDERFVNRILFEMLSTISAQTQLFVLGIPHKRHLDTASPVFTARLRLAQACGAQFLDMRQFIREFGSRYVEAGGSLYEVHPAHPHATIQNAFGRLIGQHLASTPPKPDKAQRNYVDNFRFWNAGADPLHPRRQHYKNSIIDEYFARWDEGEECFPPLPGRCIGCHVNTFATHGVLSIVDKRGAEFRIACYYPQAPDKVLKIFLPFPNGIDINSIKILPQSATVDMYSNLSKKDVSSSDSTALTVSQFVSWTGNVDLSWPIHSEDSSEALSFFSKICADLRSTQATQAVTPLHDHLHALSRGRGQDPKDFGLLTCHRTFLVYNLVDNVVRHLPASQLEHGENHYPIGLRCRGKMAEFFVAIGSFEFVLSLHSPGPSLQVTSGEDLPLEKFSFEIEMAAPDRFRFKQAGHYLCAEPSSRILCNRSVAREWESFSLGRISPDARPAASAAIAGATSPEAATAPAKAMSIAPA